MSSSQLAAFVPNTLTGRVEALEKFFLTNPIASPEDAMREIGMDEKQLQEATQVLQIRGKKSWKVMRLTDSDFEMARRAQMELLNRVRKNPGALDVKELDTIISSSLKRYTHFRGDAVDEDGGNKSPVQELTDKQLREIVEGNFEELAEEKVLTPA